MSGALHRDSLIQQSDPAGSGRQFSATAGQTIGVVLNEGQSLNISGSSVVGTYQVYGAGGAGAVSALLAPGTLGPYPGTTKVSIVCTSGTVTAATSQADLNSPVIVSRSNGDTVGLATPAGKRVDVSPRAFPRYLSNGQPVGGLRYSGSAGLMVCDFSEANTPWALASGSPTLVRDYTGFDGAGNVTGIKSKTGVPKMLKWTSVANGESIQLALGALNIALNGKLGIWVYVENQATYGPGEVFNNQGSIGLHLSTSATNMESQCAQISWNTNQVKEGWNFLKFVANTANFTGSDLGTFTTIGGVHPLGLLTSVNNAGTNANFVGQNVRTLSLNVNNMVGATIYLDSIWTGFTSKTCFVPMVDQISPDTVNTVLPMLQAKGWSMTAMAPRAVWTTGQTFGGPIYGDFSTFYPGLADALYAAGWDIINHTITHRRMGDLTSDSEIRSEVEQARGWADANGYSRGQEFYASPQSSSSRLSDKVLAGDGFLLQRHARGMNVAVTPWGIPNQNHLGSVDMGNRAAAQDSRIINACIDTMCRYGDSFFPFFHVCRTLGDDGSGTSIYSADDLNIYASNLQAVFDHMALKIQQGLAHGVMTASQFYYGA